MYKFIGLHNLARKYCMDMINTLSAEAKLWGNKFLNIYEKTKEYDCDELNKLIDEYPDLNIREDILKFILEEIEKIAPENYITENKFREDIITASKNANIRDYMHYSDRDDKVKAVAITYFHISENNCCRFDYIIISKDYRNNGFARELLSYATDFCRENNLKNCFQWPAHKTSERICYEAGFRHLFSAEAGGASL